MKRLEEMTGQVTDHIKEYATQMGTKPWNYQIAAKDLSCQVGSLIKGLMQLENERYRHGKSDQQLRGDIADELADILSLVLFIAHELKIDLNEAWQKMLISDQHKFESRSG